MESPLDYESVLHGSYANKYKRRLGGVPCLVVKLHKTVREVCDDISLEAQFNQKASALAKLRHPNVVRFLGVRDLRRFTISSGIAGMQCDPATNVGLVTEYLPYTLTEIIERYAPERIPPEIQWSIVLDILLGLEYLHRRSITHQDLCADTVLLSDNMRAKVDLSIPFLLDKDLLKLPKSPPSSPNLADFPFHSLLPPECTPAVERYLPSFDMYSFGILLLHLLTGALPKPNTDGQGIDKFAGVLESLQQKSLWTSVLERCLCEKPETRATAGDVISQLQSEEFKDSLVDSSSWWKPEEAIKSEIDCVKEFEDDKDFNKQQLEWLHKKKEVEVKQKKEEVESTKKRNELEIARLEFVKGMKVDQLQTLVHHNKQRNSELSELNEKRERQVVEEEAFISRQRAMAKEKDDLVNQHKKLIGEKAELEAQFNQLKEEIKNVEDDLDREDRQLTRYNFHLDEAVKYMSPEKQILSADLEWNECAELPTRISFAQATFIDDQVYVGGCESDDTDVKVLDLSAIHCYNLQSDEWSTLGYLQATACSFQHMPSVSSGGEDSVSHEASDEDAQLEPIIYFGLGKYPFKSEGAVETRLVAVGGFQGDTAINDLYVYAGDGRFKKWEPYPSMRHCRCKCSVISHVERSMMIVAGGNSLADQTGQMSSVELFQSGTWYQCMKLCFPCERFSSVLIDDKCYLLGGSRDWEGLTRAAMCTSIEKLEEMMMAHESSDGDSSDDEDGVFNDAEFNRERSKVNDIRIRTARSSSLPTPWQKFGVETPNYASSSACLLKSIVAVGGKSKDGEAKSSVHFFSSAINQWVQIAMLPVPLVSPTIAMLSATEFLVIGGGADAERGTKKVFKAALKFYAPQQKHL